ncbi:dialkylrecorsinol condensing enzyme [Rodentibacter caecimuris]|uniref:dialkylrecorsinol condensing enzyme n=1 Tax=Rodentibacter caecimuris TaxID=1796644 RepID=UPI0013A08DDF|nr:MULTISPECIES: dialkylrecorsinol condensing enzyme [Pasteurellaceae]MCR1837136.1 dialkylresorcinol condensing enzyme [Pasteurella caecimuris]MCU0106854.1 dialkylresorcinol condensing enzyme [Pasteurella caecimuris]QIA77150.1 dialkylresorcinol condensing enzyme [Rodentibacter heylii]
MQKESQNILVISYSQTGQLSRLVEHFLTPLQSNSIHVEHYIIKPCESYPFPWKFLSFFNQFPESVHLQPAPIHSPEFQQEKYDLVIIAYTVWFLSPSQPITAFLQSEQAKRRLKNTPVITLIGCRNMWLQAQEKMKTLLAACGANLIANVVKVDQSNDWASFITTPMWMLTGKKKALSWLPSAGIAESEIKDMQRFGEKLLQIFSENRPLDRSIFQGMGAVKIDEKLMMSEKVGSRSFHTWGKLLIKCGQISPSFRKIVLCFYIAFLIAMILTVVPISAIIKRVLKPLIRKKLDEQKRYFAEPSGE